jgi:hypothetical protein
MEQWLNTHLVGWVISHDGVSHVGEFCKIRDLTDNTYIRCAFDSSTSRYFCITPSTNYVEAMENTISSVFPRGPVLDGSPIWTVCHGPVQSSPRMTREEREPSVRELCGRGWSVVDYSRCVITPHRDPPDNLDKRRPNIQNSSTIGIIKSSR